MNASYKLTVDFQHYWRCGTGKSAGSFVDATADLDRFGCPFVAGSMLKGLLRDAVYKTCSWNSAGLTKPQGCEPGNVVEILFGSNAFSEKAPVNDTRPGILRIDDATLPDKTRHWLFHNAKHRNAMFRPFYTTAIDAESGIAQKDSLRGEMVVVPMKLTGRLSVEDANDVAGSTAPSEDTDQEHNAWVVEHHKQLLTTALPMIRWLGGSRTRGLGRCQLVMEAVS